MLTSVTNPSLVQPKVGWLVLLTILIALPVYTLGQEDEKDQGPIVFLNESAGWESIAHAKRPGGLLTRELCRQALLLAAREELGLTTRDAWLGDPMPDRGTSATLDLVFKPDDAFSIEVVRKEGEITELMYSDTIPMPGKTYLNTITQALEEKSRTDFVKALQKAGYRGAKNRWREHDEVPGVIARLLSEMTFTSQFDAARRIHRHIRSQGESPQLLGAMVRSYANLGLLTEFHWHPAHKVFKARSMLYAQRLMIRAPDWAPRGWYQGYVHALVGMHVLAIEEIQLTQDATGKSGPDWCQLALAHCRFDYAALAPGNWPDDATELARLLRCICLHLATSQKLTLKTTMEDLVAMPECYRLQDQLARWSGVSIGRSGTNSGPTVFSANLYHRLSTMEGLPSNAQKVIDRRTKIDQHDRGAEELQRELQDRQNLMHTLRSSQTKDPSIPKDKEDSEKTKPVAQHVGEPSWAALGNLIEQISFVQTYRRVSFERTLLGISPDDTLQRFSPVYIDHAFAPFLLAHTSDREARSEELPKVQQLRPVSLEIQSLRLAEGVGDAQTGIWMTFLNENHDPVARDLTLLIYSGDVDSIIRYSKQLREISPFSPTAKGQLLRYRWGQLKDFAPLWEQCDNAFVLREIARNYDKDGRFEDSERCLRTAIEIAHEQNDYRLLAKMYQKHGRLDRWQETLDEFLEQPDYGLEHSTVSSEIAWHFMYRRQWKKARPYVDRAAKSGSSKGLSAAAVWHEASQEWEKAEQFSKSISNRYHKMTLMWYGFCLRTGHGNVNSARQLAREYAMNWKSERRPVNEHHALYWLLDGQNAIALSSYELLANKGHDPWHDMCVLLLAIEANDEARRESARAHLIKHGAKFRPSRATLVRIGKMIAADAADGGRADFDAETLTQLLKHREADDMARCHYFLGKYYDLCGREKEAIEIWEDGMASMPVNAIARTLCGANLVAKGFFPEQYLTLELLRKKELDK